MKKFTKIFMTCLTIVLGLSVINALSQIHFEGYYSHGEGGAGWDADGSGPEPSGTGHGGVVYYLASRDYLDTNSSSGAHFLSDITGFPAFVQALADHGFTADQVTVQIDLASLGEDLIGVDWFIIDDMEYDNFAPLKITCKLNGEMLVKGITNYVISYIGPSTGDEWYFQSAYFTLQNISAFSPPEVQAVAEALMQDMEGYELQMNMQSLFSGHYITGNGRTGAYWDVTGTLDKGLPEFPFQGLNDDHEGFAGWDADGTGPEPFGDGHLTQLYYGASLDYGDIDPDPNACLGHFLEGSTGFFNTIIQLEYRGYDIGDLKIKLGLESLGPDVQGEDWGYENGYHWCNYYNNASVIELDGEPILVLLQDTNKLNALPTKWISEAGIGKIYDISSDASPEAQFVAQSFLRDVGTHYIKTEASNIQYVELFSGLGRNGALYEILAGKIVGVHEQATFIPEGNVYGVWNMEGSPYYIDGHITVEDGYTLTIQPGVKVAARGPYHITVDGSVLAEGTPAENITFTHSNPNVWWDGFDYDGVADSNEFSVFNYCDFQHGKAQGGGEYSSGGIFAIRDNDSLKIMNSTFSNNVADEEPTGYVICGGAIALWNADPLIQKCIFHDNFATDYGGAILVYSGSEPVISNCLFYNNESDHGGAISYYDISNGILINNTIVDNSGYMGGALHFYNQSNPQIINNILWGNTADYGNQVYIPSMFTSYPGFYYNDIEGGHEGFYGGATVDYLFNIDEDPLFIDDPDMMPYMFETGSPCKNIGTPDTSSWYYPQFLPETCLCGNPRISYERIDLGVYEYLFEGIEDEISISEDISAFPNPVSGQLTIRISLDQPAPVSMAVFNSYGAQIESRELGVMSPGDQLLTWETSGLPEGIYYCRVQIGNEIVTKKIIKVR